MKPFTYRNVPVHKVWGNAHIKNPEYKKLMLIMGKTLRAGGYVDFTHHGKYPLDKIDLIINGEK